MDTSAIAKRYMNEMGSGWIRRRSRPSAGNVIIVSQLTPVEIFSVFARLRKSGSLSVNAAKRLQNAFLKHLNAKYVLVPVDADVFRQAQLMTDKHALRIVG